MDLSRLAFVLALSVVTVHASAGAPEGREALCTSTGSHLDLGDEEQDLATLSSVSLLQIATEKSSGRQTQVSSGLDVPVVHVMYATTMNSTGPGDIGLMASMLSLSRNLDQPASAVIHLIVPQEDVASAAAFAACFRGQFAASEPRPALEVHAERPLPFDPGRNTHTTYLSANTMTFARWLMPEYFPDVSRVFYLDTDTIVQGDIRQLYEQDMDAALLLKKCGILCTVPHTETLERHYKTMIDAIPDEARQTDVMNAGVLLADLDRWRAINFTDALVSQAKSALAANVSLDDQLILNIVARRMNAVDDLPARFNVEGAGYCDVGCDKYPEKPSCDCCNPTVLDLPVSEAALLHWSGPKKQWDILSSSAPGSCKVLDQHLPRKECASS